MKRHILLQIFVIAVFNLNAQNSLVIENLKLSDPKDFEDYSIFDSLLKNKDIIFLGESGHSGYEYNETKLKLIQYIYVNHGFDVVLFESGMADCYYGNLHKSEHDSLWFMTNSIYPIWFSEPTLRLMDYAKNEDIDVAGIDYKRSYGNRNVASEFIKEINIKESALLAETYILDTTFFNAIYGVDFNLEIAHKRINFYDSIAASLNANYNSLITEINNTDWENEPSKKELLQIIKNKKFHIKYYDNPSSLSKLRDSVMSKNIEFYYDSIYKGRKIIVWAANDHIAKERSKFNSNYYAGFSLPKRIKESGYFIGLYAYSGEMYNSQSGSYSISKPKRKSLERKVKKYFKNDNDVFIDISSDQCSSKLRWIKKTLRSYVWGKITVKIIPEDYYDGIILIKKLTISR